MHTVTMAMSNLRSSSWVLHQFARLLQQQKYGQVCALLAQHFELFCYQMEPAQAAYFLAQPAHFPVIDNPDLCYIEGVLQLCAGNSRLAVVRFDRARHLYHVEGNNRSVIQATLALVHVALHTHELEAAATYLEQSQPLLHQEAEANAGLVGDFCLCMAQVLFARHRFATSQEYSFQALTAYNQTRRWRGRLTALLHLALLAVRLGDYTDAENRLRTVQQGLRRHPLLEGQLLFVEIQLHGHRRQLVKALPLAHRYVKVVDRMPDGKARLRARLQMGNLYRELGEFMTATRWYSEALQMVKTEGYQAFQQQLDLEYAWLDILEGRLPEARQRIYGHLKNVQFEPAMNLQTQLAIIHLIEGDLVMAERLLQESLNFYRRAEDRLACCALHTYLAYIALQKQSAPAILYHLDHSFGWMTRQQIESFSHWWHPDLLAAVCSQTLAADMYSDLSERILVNYLGNHGVNALTRFLHNDDLEARRRVYRLLHIISGETTNMLAHLPEGAGKSVLLMLLREGRLRADRYPLLEQELMTASYRRSPNVTLLAVFGLYLTGASRAEIAEQLGCSVENVRNYITQIYHHFGVTANTFTTRKARWQRLVELVRLRGFIE